MKARHDDRYFVRAVNDATCFAVGVNGIPFRTFWPTQLTRNLLRYREVIRFKREFQTAYRVYRPIAVLDYVSPTQI